MFCAVRVGDGLGMGLEVRLDVEVQSVVSRAGIVVRVHIQTSLSKDRG